MKKFKFRLDAVLKVRKAQESEAMGFLGVCQKKHQLEVEKKILLMNELKNSLTRRESLGSQSTPISLFIMEDQFIAGLKNRIMRADRMILKALKQVENAKQAYLGAKLKKDAMEKLRENDLNEFHSKSNRQEQKTADDLTLSRFKTKELRHGGKAQ